MNEENNFEKTGQPSASREEALSNLQEIGKEQKKMGRIVKILSAAAVLIVLSFCWWGHRAMVRGPARELVKEGIQMMHRGNYGQAVEKFKKATEKDESFHLPYYLSAVAFYDMYRGSLYYEEEVSEEERKENLDNMYSYLKKSLEKDGNHVESHIYLGVYYYYKNQKKDALLQFQKGMSLGEKKWGNSDSKKDKWTGFSEIAIDALTSAESADTIYTLGDKSAEVLKSKITDPTELEYVDWIIYGDGTKEEWAERFSWYGLSEEDLNEVMKYAEPAIPEPPAPDELDQVFMPMM